MNLYAGVALASERCLCAKPLALILLPPAIRCISGSESRRINRLILIFFPPRREGCARAVREGAFRQSEGPAARHPQPAAARSRSEDAVPEARGRCGSGSPQAPAVAADAGADPATGGADPSGRAAR